MLKVGNYVRGNDGFRNWIGEIVEVHKEENLYRVRNIRTGLYFYVSCDAVNECARP